jgi:hypothetical protein
VGVGQDRPDPLGGRHRRRRVVGPDDAAAGGQRHRLDHARKPHFGGQSDHVGPGWHRPETGLGHPGGGQRQAHGELVAGGGRRRWRVVGQTETFPGHGRHQNALVVDGHDPVDRSPLGGPGDHLGRPGRVVEVDREGPVAHGGRQRLFEFRGDHDLDTEPGGGGQEVGRLVRGRGQQDQHAGHAGIMAGCPRRNR